MNENKGFTIICNDCGCKECSHEEDWDYDFDDEPFLNATYLYCPNCGQRF